MDPQLFEIFKFISWVLPMVAIIVALGVGGSHLSTWLRVKKG